ncbi:hypothetical protein EIP91_000056 [Steccherinum ochraceum]|uniref:Uncharacterized protein n=1 Tax=Steccherinum ochraceum TaxID=92696 RepID=A0A4R0S4F0_9APHY|nr:hypothetical protein EIP91_000056 [Steccherinum ochraceum]
MLASANSPPPSPLAPRFPLQGSPQKAISHLRLPDVANLLVKIRRVQSRAQAIESSSGEGPRTHFGLELTCERKVPLYEEGRFVCRDGVDAAKLLRAVRSFLYEKAESIGANVLVDEQWSCAISGPRRGNTYRVLIRYSASASRSSTPDPQRPVGLENIRNVDGLMTILSREE